MKNYFWHEVLPCVLDIVVPAFLKICVGAPVVAVNPLSLEVLPTNYDVEYFHAVLFLP